MARCRIDSIFHAAKAVFEFRQGFAQNPADCGQPFTEQQNAGDRQHDHFVRAESRLLRGHKVPNHKYDADETIGGPPVDGSRAEAEPPAIGLANPAPAREPGVPVTFDGDEWPVEYGKKTKHNTTGETITNPATGKDIPPGGFMPQDNQASNGKSHSSRLPDPPPKLSGSTPSRDKVEATRDFVNYLLNKVGLSGIDLAAEGVPMTKRTNTPDWAKLEKMVDEGKFNPDMTRKLSSLIHVNSAYRHIKQVHDTQNAAVSADYGIDDAADLPEPRPQENPEDAAERRYAAALGYIHVGQGQGSAKAKSYKAFDVQPDRAIRMAGGKAGTVLDDVKLISSRDQTGLTLDARSIGGLNKGLRLKAYGLFDVPAVPRLVVFQTNPTGMTGVFVKVNGEDFGEPVRFTKDFAATNFDAGFSGKVESGRWYRLNLSSEVLMDESGHISDDTVRETAALTALLASQFDPEDLKNQGLLREAADATLMQAEVLLEDANPETVDRIAKQSGIYKKTEAKMKKAAELIQQGKSEEALRLLRGEG